MDEITNVEMKNCPFCGETIKVFSYRDPPTEYNRHGLLLKGKKHYAIHCYCGIELESTDKNWLITRWNTRSSS